MTNVFIDTVQRTLRGRLAGGLTVNAGVHPQVGVTARSSSSRRRIRWPSSVLVFRQASSFVHLALT
jgi:hypothetical protein